MKIDDALVSAVDLFDKHERESDNEEVKKHCREAAHLISCLIHYNPLSLATFYIEGALK